MFELSLFQCEVVEISDEEDSLVTDNDVEIKPKDEVLDYDLPLPKICPQHGVVWLICYCREIILISKATICGINIVIIFNLYKLIKYHLMAEMNSLFFFFLSYEKHIFFSYEMNNFNC